MRVKIFELLARYDQEDVKSDSGSPHKTLGGRKGTYDDEEILPFEPLEK